MKETQITNSQLFPVTFEHFFKSPCYCTLAIFEMTLNIVVFANEVKQSRSIFNSNPDLDCFANARKDGLLANFIKMAKV